jgi:hypothetical protein
MKMLPLATQLPGKLQVPAQLVAWVARDELSQGEREHAAQSDK